MTLSKKPSEGKEDASTAVDLFNDLWDSLTHEQRAGIAWLATYRDKNGDIRTLGSAETMKGFLNIAAAALDSFGKYNTNSFEDYRDEIIAALKGIGTGLLDGGIRHYLRYR